MGGLIGAAVASAGIGAVNGSVVVTKVLIPAVAAPIVAGVAAMLAAKVTYKLGGKVGQKTSTKGYRAGQIASAGLVSLAHGTNDAQKTMGIITLALVAGGALDSGANPPVWVIISAGLAIALGTSLGGWRIIRTMGSGLTDLQPQQGFAAQTSAASVILASSSLGFSLSTTHACSGAVMGAGLGRKGGVVRWSTATRMFIAWGLTLPAAAVVASGAELVMRTGDIGVAAVALFLIASCVAIWAISRRQVVDHHNVNDARTAAAEEPGVVTTAMAAVTVPPTMAAEAAAGTTAAVADEDLKATIPAAAPATPAAPAAPAAAV